MAIRSILVYTDLSEAWQRAAALASTMAASFRAPMHFLRVIEEPLSAGWTAEAGAAVLPEVQEAATIETREQLNRIIPEGQQDALVARLQIETGAAADEILRYAAEREIDLIVVGVAEGDDGQAQLAGDVTRSAACSVLVARTR